MARRGDGIYRRGKAWRLDFIHQGKRHQLSLGRCISRSVAREIASIRRAAILRGEVGIGRKRKDIAFSTAVDLFLRWLEANKKANTLKACRSHMKQLTLSFGGKSLSDISPFLIEKHKIRRLTEGSPVALNRELSYLKLLFNRCLAWDKFEGKNPVLGIQGSKESLGRTRWLTKDEEVRLLANAGQPLQTIIVVGIYTGLRITAEVLSLRWENVDLERGYLTVEGAYSKNHETETMPLSTKVVEALKEIKNESKSDYVFVNRNGQPMRSVRTAFTTACGRANLPGVSLHVLRHTFASRLREEGVSDGTIQVLGRWKEPKMVRRYAHINQESLKKAVERIADNSTTVSTPPHQQETCKSFVRP